MTMSTPATRPYDAVDLSSREFWAAGAAERERSFAVLREARPVSWHPRVEGGLLDDPDDPGFWAVVRHADMTYVSRHHDVFVSGRGVIFENTPAELLEASQSFLAMDPPRHDKIRKLVSAAFTPRRVRALEGQIVANAEAVVTELAAAGSGVDFVAHCASQLPIRTLSDMMGIPAEERLPVMQNAEALVSSSDPVYLNGRPPLEVMFQASATLHEIASTLAAARRAEPRDDLMTNLVQADIDGQRLTDAEIAAFFVLVAVAGNDTTRQTTSHALKALTDFPAQREWLLADFDNRINGAVEEFVRWSTPVMTFRRTAVVDTELGGQRISAGDKVVMCYPSGNWDTEVFTDPGSLDLGRSPNPHVGFGGGGVHFCLGAQVARTQLRAIFSELLTRLPDIQAGEQELLAGNFIHAVRAMPCTFTA
jgi:cytochrome P450